MKESNKPEAFTDFAIAISLVRVMKKEDEAYRIAIFTWNGRTIDDEDDP